MNLLQKLDNITLKSTTKTYKNTRFSRSSQFISESNIITRPPLKSIIRNVLPKRKMTFMAPKDRENREKNLPVNWSWKGKDGISEPFDQKLCGSCWAVSAAQLFSDVIAIKMKISKNPEISATHILMCHGQYQCEGGIPGKALDDLIKRGATTQKCIDYSWCTNDDKCNGSSLEHLNNQTGTLNDLIPYCIGCKQPPYKIMGEYVTIESERNLDNCQELDLAAEKKSLSCQVTGKGMYRYYAKNAFAVFAENDGQVDDARYDVKEHIMEVGPCMGAFFILSNFLDAVDYEETGGIYMENFQYKTLDGRRSALNEDSELDVKYKVEGGHAVIVVGWGVQNIDTINPQTGNKYGTVGYWIVKNTWGSEWNGDGHFKMAMYPHNKFSQFDKALDAGVDGDGKKVWMGGMYLIEYDRKIYQPINRFISQDGSIREIERDILFNEKYVDLNIMVVGYTQNDTIEIIVTPDGSEDDPYNFILNRDPVNDRLSIKDEYSTDSIIIDDDPTSVIVDISNTLHKIKFTYDLKDGVTIDSYKTGTMESESKPSIKWWLVFLVFICGIVVSIAAGVFMYKQNKKTQSE
jgi:hypothetical protein